MFQLSTTTSHDVSGMMSRLIYFCLYYFGLPHTTCVWDDVLSLIFLFMHTLGLPHTTRVWKDVMSNINCVYFLPHTSCVWYAIKFLTSRILQFVYVYAVFIFATDVLKASHYVSGSCFYLFTSFMPHETLIQLMTLPSIMTLYSLLRLNYLGIEFYLITNYFNKFNCTILFFYYCAFLSLLLYQKLKIRPDLIIISDMLSCTTPLSHHQKSTTC